MNDRGWQERVRGSEWEEAMKTVVTILLVIIGALAVLLVVAMVGFNLSRQLRPNTILALRIEGEIPERAAGSVRDWLSGSTATVTDLTEAIDRARTDPHITGLEVRVSETTMNMGKNSRKSATAFGLSMAPANSVSHTWSSPRTSPITSLPLARPSSSCPGLSSIFTA